MNLEAQTQLFKYMNRPLKDLTQDQLQDYLWLVEWQLQEILQQVTARRPPWELDNPRP